MVAAIELQPTGAKAANVVCGAMNRRVPVLLTVVFVGDVAAVGRPSVQAAAAAKKVGQVVAVHVIDPDTIRNCALSPTLRTGHRKK